MTTVLAIGRKEFRQILRDRRTLTILLGIPMLFLLLFGYALTFDVRHIALAVEDRDNTSESRALVRAFVNSGYFDLTTSFTAEGELQRLMDRNTIRAALIIPENTGRALRRGERAPVQVLINGENANTAATILGYSQVIVREVSTDLVADSRGVSRQPPVTVEPRVWFNPELRSALFLVPGLIAFIGMIVATISTAISIVREKERGTWEQVRMAPVHTPSYLIGKTLPYLMISMVSSMTTIVAAMGLFGLPVRGSWAALILATALFLVGALGTGLLVSTVSQSQLVAFQMALMGTFLPTFVLSGFLFPIANMPRLMQFFSHVVPARYFLVAMRGIALKGVSLATVWTDMAAMAAYALIVLGIASRRLARERR